jgi:aspartyl-tRNA(Asn)/glutamyl-tRNA(Gln) amidotransferase subunit B
VAKVIGDNPDVVERIRGGNAKAMGALVGPIMRETKGKADGGEVNRLIREQLGV